MNLDARPERVDVARVRQMWPLLRAVLIVIAVFGTSSTFGSISTTIASGDDYVYDVPTIAHAEAFARGSSEAGQSLLRDVGEGSAPTHVDARGTSTTPTRSLVATEAVRPGASFSQLYDGGGGVIAQVDDAGVLNLAIEAGAGTPQGGQMFNRALSEVGRVNGIRGTWNPSMPSNLDAFNANIRAGMSAKEAARATFTGTMAGRAGFTNVAVEQLSGTPGAYTNVKVVFGG